MPTKDDELGLELISQELRPILGPPPCGAKAFRGDFPVNTHELYAVFRDANGQEHVEIAVWNAGIAEIIEGGDEAYQALLLEMMHRDACRRIRHYAEASKGEGLDDG